MQVVSENPQRQRLVVIFTAVVHNTAYYVIVSALSVGKLGLLQKLGEEHKRIAFKNILAFVWAIFVFSLAPRLLLR